MLAMPPLAARAEPIKLKFSFFTSDRSKIYHRHAQAVRRRRERRRPGLDRDRDVFQRRDHQCAVRKKPQVVADGVADMAYIVPGQSLDRFGDNAIMELPGIYNNSREASLVFNRLIEAGALKGYGDYVVVSAFVSGGESIHSRTPIASIQDLKNMTICTNNGTEAAVLEKLGAIPVLMPINQTTQAISRGKIDAATFPPSMLFEFGIGRVTSHHYMIPLGGAPTALVMNRQKFASLPPQAQAIYP